MKFDILTIFPEILDSYFQHGMMRLAQEKKLIKIKNHDLRDFAVDKHGTVDDKPYGGGPGQVLMVEPVYRALKKINPKRKTSKAKTKTILLSAKGRNWDQKQAEKLSKYDRLIFVCPRYEGHDERIKQFVDEEISIGDYVLTGGELGTAVIIDSVTRLIPGVLGQKKSLAEESHSTPGYKEYPQYTRPEVFSYKRKKNNKFITKELRVPSVLLSGHHEKIKSWRQKHSRHLENN